MTATLTIGLAGFASTVCEAPASVQSKILRTRLRIFRVGGRIAKLLLAVVCLPFLSTLLWLTVLMTALLAPMCVSLNREVIRGFRKRLAASHNLDGLRGVASHIQTQLPKLEDLFKTDAAVRNRSEVYKWLVSGFDQELEELIADYEDILESMQMGLDPKWRQRLMDEIKEREAANVA